MNWNDKEEVSEYNRKYYQAHKEEIISKKSEYNKAYTKTKMGRAQKQYQQYKFMDVKNGFGDIIDFDARWIVDNIYTKQCAHCCETDWHKLGCNRIDNTKGHTIDNVEPCCFHCNCVLNGNDSVKRIVETMSKHVYGYDNDWNLVVSFQSCNEAGRNGYNYRNISACCLGKRKTHKGLYWTYEKRD